MHPGTFSNSASKTGCTLSGEIYSEIFPQYSLLHILKFSIFNAEHLGWHKMCVTQMKWSLGLSWFYKLFWFLWKPLNFPFHENCPFIVFMATFISHLRAPKHTWCIFYDSGILILYNSKYHAHIGLNSARSTPCYICLAYRDPWNGWGNGFVLKLGLQQILNMQLFTKVDFLSFLPFFFFFLDLA